jgi:hypothetical protein
VNRHQVVGLSSRSGKSSFQKLIKRLQPVHSSVLPGSNMLSSELAAELAIETKEDDPVTGGGGQIRILSGKVDSLAVKVMRGCTTTLLEPANVQQLASSPLRNHEHSASRKS